jgi:hypothetical protein
LSPRVCSKKPLCFVTTLKHEQTVLDASILFGNCSIDAVRSFNLRDSLEQGKKFQQNKKWKHIYSKNFHLFQFCDKKLGGMINTMVYENGCWCTQFYMPVTASERT